MTAPTWRSTGKALGRSIAPPILSVVARNLKEEKAGADGRVFFSDRELQVYAALSTVFSRIRSRPLRVLDWGGELGAYQRSLKGLWGENNAVHWTVLETPTMAAAGTRHFSTKDLEFTSNRSVLTNGCDVVLASGVLQCLEDPAAAWTELSASSCPYIILTIFPLIARARDVLTVRGSGAKGSRGDYPLWVFSEAAWRIAFSSKYRIVMEWALDKNDRLQSGDPVKYRGFLLEDGAIAPNRSVQK
jgi:putative methyltransferase (TIGR04325 family)